MPIYEYECGNCGHHLEVLQRISEDPLKDCPACSKPALSRLISAAGFRLKGGGWYETDFKTGNRKNVTEKQKSETKSASSSDSGGSASSGGGESKPAATGTD
ncbi:MAG: zinc ribbon domain-containing protein [Pseudomonadota bacterium]|nr:zinc ribbon domain-containing protein [Pseudomonadota bacterium]